MHDKDKADRQDEIITSYVHRCVDTWLQDNFLTKVHVAISDIFLLDSGVEIQICVVTEEYYDISKLKTVFSPKQTMVDTIRKGVAHAENELSRIQALVPVNPKIDSMYFEELPHCLRRVHSAVMNVICHKLDPIGMTELLLADIKLAEEYEE